MRKVFTTASLYRTTSSSSRHRGYVGDVAKAQPVHHLSSVTQCWCTVGTVGALRIAIVVSPLPTSHAVFPTSLCETDRSEEHTSELQSRLHLVCRLLLEKKKTT